jgi:hypothetical protein
MDGGGDVSWKKIINADETTIHRPSNYPDF